MKSLKFKITMALSIFNSIVIFAQKPETSVSADFPFAEKKQHVNGTPISYYEQGQGDPILFLHGIPTSSYLWRNIVPQVATQGRSIAFDLAGFENQDFQPTKITAYNLNIVM